MKSIATINTSLPTVENNITYHSGQSLLDYDIFLFDPKLPYETRIDFSGGGSCIAIEGYQRLKKSMTHWLKEFNDALRAGKTIFILLNTNESDSGATGYTTRTKGTRQYSTSSINNYEVLPVNISIRNAKGKQLKIVDSRFKVLYNAIKDITEFRVVFTSEIKNKIFTTRDETSVVSGILKLNDFVGNLVFLPYFNIEPDITYEKGNRKDVWSKDTISTSERIVGQLLEIDKVIRAETLETPKPDWVESFKNAEKGL